MNFSLVKTGCIFLHPSFIMKRIFGVSKPPPAPGPPPPTLQEASESIDKRYVAIDEKIKQCDAELLKYKSQLSGPNAQSIKTRALTVLKRKKMYESQKDALMATQFNVDQANFATENLRITAITVDALKAGTAQLKQEFAKMNIDSIEAVADEMEDLLYDQQDINEILGRSYAVPDGFDEAALEGEFAQLEEEVALERMSGATVPSYIPDNLPGQQDVAMAPSAPVATNEQANNR